MIAACVVTAAFASAGPLRGEAEAPRETDAPPPLFRPRGAEQANVWIPLEVITLGTEAQRRRAMLDRITREVARRHSTIDMARLDHVLAAMNLIARERFLEEAKKRAAYVPASLDIGYGQTISDAYIVAVMTVAAALPVDANVLDIGTGSGYQAALLSVLAHRVTSIEIVPQLAKQARARLKRLGYRNVDVRHGDGGAGWAPDAPFDAIIVAAGTPVIPPALIDQLKTGGRLVIPVGPTALDEELVVVTKRSDAFEECSLGPATFVPMTGQVRARSGAKDTPARRPRIRMCYAAPIT